MQLPCRVWPECCITTRPRSKENSMLVADHLCRRLLEWNVRRIYGYPGDGIGGVLGALDRLGGENEFVQTVMVPAQVRHVVDRAIRIAQGTRAVTCVIVPNDVQLLDAVEEPPRKHGTVHSSAAYAAPRVIPRDEELEDAAELLNAG